MPTRRVRRNHTGRAMNHVLPWAQILLEFAYPKRTPGPLLGA